MHIQQNYTLIKCYILKNCTILVKKMLIEYHNTLLILIDDTLIYMSIK